MFQRLVRTQVLRPMLSNVTDAINDNGRTTDPWDPRTHHPLEKEQTVATDDDMRIIDCGIK